MNLDEIIENWKIDSVIDSYNISNEAIKNAKLHSKYLTELVNFKSKLIDLKSDYNLMRQFKRRYYRGELSKEELTKYSLAQYQGPKHLKTELVEILDGDVDLINIQKEIDIVELGISSIETIIKAIFSRGFDIKNHIENEKFRSGN
jgi:hypothetical protein